MNASIDEIIEMCKRNTLKIEYTFYNESIQDVIRKTAKPTYYKEYKFTSFEMSKDKESVRIFYEDIDIRFYLSSNAPVYAYLHDERFLVISPPGYSLERAEMRLKEETFRIGKKCPKGVLIVDVALLLEEWDVLSSIAERMKLDNKSFFKEVCSSIEDVYTKKTIDAIDWDNFKQ